MSDFIDATDIEFNKKSESIAATQVNSCCKYIKIYALDSKDLIYDSYTWSWENVSFSNNNELLISHVNSFLLLFPSHLVTSSVNGLDNNSLDLTVTPNPASNTISIHFKSVTNELTNLSIIDLVGNQIDIIDEGIIANQSYSIYYNISNLPPATYFIRLEVGGEIFTKKFIKE